MAKRLGAWHGWVLVAVTVLVLVLVSPQCQAGIIGKIPLTNAASEVSSEPEQQQDPLVSPNLRGSQPQVPLDFEAGDENAESTDNKRHGTVCIYQGSSCLERAQGKPGKFASCNSEVEDGICMNFPTAGIVFKCSNNNNLIAYPTPGCGSDKNGVEQPIVCVDMTLGTYLLLCCADKGSHGEPCAYDGAPLALSPEDQQKQTWEGGKFVKW